MTRIRRVLLPALLLLGVTLFFARFGFTVVTIEHLEAMQLAGLYDADEYVEEIWSDLLVPAIDENAVDLAVVLSTFQVNDDGTVGKDRLSEVVGRFGRTTVGEAHVYMVEGSGLVTEVDTGSRVGTLLLSVDGYDGPTNVRVFIGPRIPSDESSVRDAVGFINFGDFRDQTEYGRVAAAINRKVYREILEPLDIASLVGERIRLRGAFSIRTFNRVDIDLNAIYVTPTFVDVE
jgi:predicted lipoprotein